MKKATYSMDKIYNFIYADKVNKCGWLYVNGEAIKLQPGEEIPEGFETEKIVTIAATS